MYDVNWCQPHGYIVLEIATGLTPHAMTEVFGGWSFYFASLASRERRGQSRGGARSAAFGGGTPGTAFPTVRILYAERELATGREVLLALRLAQPTRPEFAPGQARYAEREPATGREGPMV